jgi:hypothetical protein
MCKQYVQFSRLRERVTTDQQKQRALRCHNREHGSSYNNNVQTIAITASAQWSQQRSQQFASGEHDMRSAVCGGLEHVLLLPVLCRELRARIEPAASCFKSGVHWGQTTRTMVFTRYGPREIAARGSTPGICCTPEPSSQPHGTQQPPLRLHSLARHRPSLIRRGYIDEPAAMVRRSNATKFI